MKAFSLETRAKMSASAKDRCARIEWIKAQHDRATKLDYDAVSRLYASGKSQAEVGEILGVSQKVVWRFMKNNSIPSRKAAKRNQFGENNSSWRGGRTVDEFGYVMIRCLNHPRASSCGFYVPEHILVAEKSIGRYLYEDEAVHHINGVKDDNRPENLEVMTRSEHTHLHWLICKYVNGVYTDDLDYTGNQ